MKNVMAILVAVVVALPLAGGCKSKKSVQLTGSTLVQSVASELARKFNEKNSEIKVQVNGGGSGQGIQALADATADIGTCSRELEPKELEKFKGVPIAYDGLAVIVNPANKKVADLTIEQIQQLFSGQITDWKDVGGDPGKVDVVVREEGSGTREAFTKMIMEHNKSEAKVARDAIVQQSNGTVRETVKSDPRAIGYMSLGLVSNEVKAIKIGGKTPTVAAIRDKEYQFVRPFLFVMHKDKPLRPEAQKFVDFVLSDEGQDLLAKYEDGLIPVKVVSGK